MVGLLDLCNVLFALLLSLGYLAPRTLGKLGELFCPLPIKLDAAPVRGDFAFQSLHFRAGIGDLDIDLVHFLAFFRERIFTGANLRACRVLGFGETPDFFLAGVEISFERVELFAGIMRFKHAEVRMQRLVAPRFACLPLQ